MKTVAIKKDYFEGVVSFDENDGGVAPARLPVEQAALFPSTDDGLMARALSPSGCRLRFVTDSSRLVVGVVPADTTAEPRSFDLCLDDRLLSTVEIPSGATQVEIELGAAGDEGGRRRGASAGGAATAAKLGGIYELWFHQFHKTILTSLEIDDGTSLEPAPDTRPRWVTYGSSITMCRQAASPARTWPATAARAGGVNLTSLGFAGQCHLDNMVARVIRDRAADIISLKLGINVFGASSLSARTYTAAVIAFVRTIRDGHPHTPIAIITAIPEIKRINTPNLLGLTLEQYREMTRDAARRLRTSGDDHLYLYEGNLLLHDDKTDLLPDGVHPNAAGYELMGRRFAETVLPELLAAAGK